MLNGITVWAKANFVTLIEVIGLAAAFVFAFSLFKIQLGFSWKGPFKLPRWSLFVFIGLLLLIGVPWLAWSLMKVYILAPGETLKNVLSAKPLEVLLGVIGWSVVVYLFLYPVILKGDPVVSETAKKPVGNLKIPIPFIKIDKRFKRNHILIISRFGEWNSIPPNYFSLFLKLNGLAPCDFLRGPEDISKTRYRLVIILATNSFYTQSGLYKTAELREAIDDRLIDFLKRGNYLIAFHDCHFWGRVGHFGPPQTVSLRITANRKHRISRGVDAINLQSEEGSHSSDPIRFYPSNSIRGHKILFTAKNLTSTTETGEVRPNLEIEPFPAGWLLKYRRSRFNIFYWFAAHSDFVYINEDFNTMVYNAAKYFLRKP